MIFEAPDDNFAGIFGKDKHLFRAAQWLFIGNVDRDCSSRKRLFVLGRLFSKKDCSLRKVILNQTFSADEISSISVG